MDVPKTLDDIRAVKGVFPADEIEPGDSVLDLMCAGFYGANAAIHVLDRKPSRYVGVDIDGEKLDAMRAIYPADVCEFQRQVAEKSLSFDLDPVGFDVVICDPWTQGIPEWMPRIVYLQMPAQKVIILGTSALWLEGVGRKPTPEDLTDWSSKRFMSFMTCRCTRVIRRSDHLGGTFWTVWR